MSGLEGVSFIDTVRLSKREREALAHLAQGLSNREIADRLGISVNTVNKHVQQIFTKLNVRNRVQAARKALEQERPLAS
ncbi:MAG TPA: LuxR C-terminal-related transcriptional regulator [Candidatus Dormibacteraeota bacterium]|jgi:DNA-binding CsgD family transcriptional regulator